VTPDKGTPSEVQPTGFRALNDGRDSSMTRTYVQVMVLEAVIIAGLWIFGQVFSSL
jgi:hypothetical protein